MGGQGSWTAYSNEAVNDALNGISVAGSQEEMKTLYSVVDSQVQQDVPMFSAYVVKTLAAANKRLVNAQPSVYGFLNHVEKWDVAQ